MMKRAVKIIVILILILVALLIGINMFLGPIIKTGVAKVGPGLLGAPIELQQCRVALLRGHVSLEGLVVGSPEGFNADHVFKLGKVVVDMDPASLLSGAIHITRIYIKDPGITYEQALTGSNLGKIMDTLGGEKESGAAEPVDQKRDQKSGKKVIIDEVVIEGGQIKVAVAALGGNGLTVPLPTLTLKDIGKEKGGTSPAEAVSLILGAVFKSVTAVVGSVAGLAGDGAKAVVGVAGAAGSATVDVLKGAGDGAAKAIKSVGGLLGGEKN
ncbi:MAG: hypothetical protein V2A34_03220 [Lentisphaerota bacterium]